MKSLTQSRGLACDTSIYPQSIFLSDWCATMAYADVDRNLIRLLYRPKMTTGLDASEVDAVLESILLTE
ncbi:MAG: DUF2927 domain-containing protein [Tunicatimonas sp.]